MTHQTLIKVRGYHLDIYQHVNNARYLEFLEEARWGYLEDSGDIEWFAKHKLAWIIVNININYRVAATMGDTLQVFTRFSKIGGKSAVVTQEVRIVGKDAIAADAQVTIVCLDQKTGKPIAIEGELKARMQQHIADA
jgi:thioesterase-3